MEIIQNILLLIKQPFLDNISNSVVSNLINKNCCIQCAPFGKINKNKSSKSPIPSQQQSPKPEPKFKKNESFSSRNGSLRKKMIERIRTNENLKELTTISSLIEKFRDVQEKQTSNLENKYATIRFVNKNSNCKNVIYSTADVSHEMFVPCEGFDKFYENNSTYKRNYDMNEMSIIDDNISNSDLEYSTTNFENISPHHSIIKPPPRRKRRIRQQHKNIQLINELNHQPSDIYEDINNYPKFSEYLSSDKTFSKRKYHNTEIPITCQPRRRNECDNMDLIINLSLNNIENEVTEKDENLSPIRNKQDNNYQKSIENVKMNKLEYYNKINELKNFNCNLLDKKNTNKIDLKSGLNIPNNKITCPNTDLTKTNEFTDHKNSNNNSAINKIYSLSHNNLESILSVNDEANNTKNCTCNGNINAKSESNMFIGNKFVENKIYYVNGPEIIKKKFNSEPIDTVEGDEIIICESIMHSVNMSNEIKNNKNYPLIPANSTYRRLYSDSLYKDESQRSSLSSIDIQLEQITRLKKHDNLQSNYQKIIRSPFVKFRSISLKH